MDKRTIGGLWVLVGCVWKARHRLEAARPLRGLDLFFVVALAANLLTALTNSEQLVTGPTVRQGMTLYDGVTQGVRTCSRSMSPS